MTAPNGAVYQETIHVRDGQTNTFSIVFNPDKTLTDNRHSAEVSLDEVSSALAWAGNLGKTSGMAEAKGLYSQAQVAYSAGQNWDAAQLSQQACDALAIKIDGEAGDWSGVLPLYTQDDVQSRANNSEFRRFFGTMDGLALVMQFEFNTLTPQRDFLFELDTGSDGVLDYAVTASRVPGNILLNSDEYAGNPALIFTHIIPTIDVLYGHTVEIRIPLADLGNPDQVEVVLYREVFSDGNPSGVIPSLGVIEAPSGQITLRSIVVSPDNDILPVGGTQQFTAWGFDADGNEVVIEPIWKTSNGTITSDGLYTAETAGNFNVTASVKNSYVTGTAGVEVIQTTVTPWLWYLGGLLVVLILSGAGYWIYRLMILKRLKAEKYLTSR